MKNTVIMLSDLQRQSYRITGDLWRKSFGAAGIEMIEHQTPESPEERLKLSNKYSGKVVFHNTLGFLFKPLEKCFNIALPAHEWNRYPAPWVENLNSFQQVWANSEHVLETMKKSGVSVDLLWQPMALDLEAIPQKSSWTSHTPFRFLACGEPHFRKGWHLLMDGFQRAFPRPGQAILTIKTSPGCEWNSPREDIIINKKQLERDEILAIYQQHDAFVTTSLAEGLGLPLAEAILARLPVIAADWGGHCSILRDGQYVPMEFEVIDQPFCSVPEYYADGQQCALSRPDKIAMALHKMYETGEDDRKTMAIAAENGLLRTYGHEQVALQIKQRFATLPLTG